MKGVLERLKLCVEICRSPQTAGHGEDGYSAGEKSGKIVAEAENISFAFDDGKAGGVNLLNPDSARRQGRPDRPQRRGQNHSYSKYCSASWSLKQGTVKTGTNLNIAYFDQYRSALDESKTVQDNVSGGRDMLEIGGKSRHVISYLQDFLFSPDRCRQPVSALSGGERNRLLAGQAIYSAVQYSGTR